MKTKLEKRMRIVQALQDNLEAQQQESLLIACINGSLKGYGGQILRVRDEYLKDRKFHEDNLAELEMLYNEYVKDLNLNN